MHACSRPQPLRSTTAAVLLRTAIAWADVLPVGDDTERLLTPVLAPLLALAGVLAAAALLLGGHGWSAAALLLAGWWIQVYGAGLESIAGRLPFALVVTLGAGAGAVIASAAVSDPRLAAAAAAGATATVIAIHLVRLRRGRVLALNLVPPFAGIIALPAWLWAMVWALLMAGLAELGAFQVGA